MAEESPRLAAEEESEGEGEEATEAPLVEAKKEEPLGAQDSKEKPAEAPVPKNNTQEPVIIIPATPPKVKRALPLLPTPPAFHHSMLAYPSILPTYFTPAASTLPSTTTGVNVFANDGSFLELFKKKMEESPAGSKEETLTQEDKKLEPDKRKPISFVGKRRGGAKLALKTGLVVKKPKADEEEVVVQKGGAWAQYMAEVKKYKAHQCSDDDKTRPLVK